MTSSPTTTVEEPRLAAERRDKRIVAVVTSATVLVSLVLLYAH